MEIKIALIFVTACVASAAKLEKVGSDPLFVSAFNVQVFGKSKMSKPDVVDILVKIIQRYDLVVIQEIRDIDVVAFPQLVNEVNAKTGNAYSSILSPRTGRTSSKEQYGFIYRHDRLQAINHYQYDEGNQDPFEREPYIVQFQRISGGTQKLFNFIALHAKPDDAINEMNELVTVYDNSVSITGLQDALIGGDLNADCNYVCASCWPRVELRQDARFTWMIPDSADTTVSTTDCAYDRLITTGSMTTNSYGARVFNFEAEYGLTYEQAKDVSDHYPVEFNIY